MKANKIIKTSCDMGSIKIFSENLSSFFGNDIGDFPNTVRIYKQTYNPKNVNKLKFLGHFSVKEENSVWLSSYDCEDDKAYLFDIGRWFVFLERDTTNFHIYKIDEDIHS